MTQQERSLIDRYIDNSLSGVELKEFMDRLESDTHFRKTVGFQNLLIESIQMAEDRRIEKELISSIGYRKSLIPFGLKLIITFLFITTCGIVLWQYIGTSTRQKGRNIFNFVLFKKGDDKSGKVKSRDKAFSNIKEELSSTTLEESKMKEGESESNSQNTNFQNEDSADVASALAEENVEVKQDQLLVTHTLKVSGISIDDKNKSTESSMAQSTTSKLNPAAGLIETPKSNNADYEVEFWISPVNYRGYKLNSNKLVLFGIEEPDAVILYYIDNKLTMKYGQEFFRLNQSDEFVSFSTIKNTDLPAALR